MFAEFLPTKFLKKITFEEFAKMNEVEKIGLGFFFEINLFSYKGKYFDLIGKIKQSCFDFDFLNSKTNEKNIIVSEHRLNLINQIYFKSYEIKNVYVFELHKPKTFYNIFKQYEIEKKNDAKIKRSGLALIGSFGKIYNTEVKEIYFSHNQLKYFNDKTINWKASPQIAMFISDMVALRLFEIIQANKEFVLSWNTDGLTTLKKLPLQISNKSGLWKLKNINAICFLESENGSRVFYKNIEDNKILNYSSIQEIDGKFYQIHNLKMSSLKKGYYTKILKVEIDKNNKFVHSNTFRNLIMNEIFRKNILNETINEF